VKILTGQNHNTKVRNQFFENVAKFRYLGRTPTNQNHINAKFKEQTEVRECLLLFGAEYFVLQFAIRKYKDGNTENYNFACFVWV
jgi:hypothetical protein